MRIMGLPFSRAVGLILVFLLTCDGSVAARQDEASNFSRAKLLREQGKTDEALALLNEISVREPKRKGLARELGIAYYKKSDFAKALPYLRQARDEDTEDKEVVQLLGLSYYFTGKPSEAIPLLERAQSWLPVANVDALYVLGLCYLSAENYDAAREVFARMFGTPADSAASYLFTGRMLVRQEVKPVAERYLQKAVTLDPKLPMAHYLLGELYLSESKVEEAIGELEKEIDINPGFAGAYYELAEAQTRLEKYDDAERLLQRSIWLDAASTGPYILLGEVLEKKGEADLAARTFQRVLSMDPNNPLPHYMLGRIYQHLGRKDEADREFKLSEELRQRQSSRP
jgi:tetratricopeptide (TPR) repeat protein